MATSIRELHAMLSTVLGEVYGWKESAFPYPLFPGTESRNTQDHRFAVGPLDTPFRALDRQVTTVGALGDTTFGIRWCVRTRVGGLHVDDYLDGFDAEGELIAALKADTRVGALVRFVSRQQPTIDGDGTVMTGEFRVVIVHHYPLQAA